MAQGKRQLASAIGERRRAESSASPKIGPKRRGGPHAASLHRRGPGARGACSARRIRVASAIEFLTRGYTQDPKDEINGALFSEAEYQEMILCKDLDFYSLCEHHMLPFFGKAHVAYLPNKRIVGLSKLAEDGGDFRAPAPGAGAPDDRRSRRRSWSEIEPLGVAVVLEAEHMCMRMRGVEKQNSLRHDLGDAGRVSQECRDPPGIHEPASARQSRRMASALTDAGAGSAALERSALTRCATSSRARPSAWAPATPPAPSSARSAKAASRCAACRPRTRARELAPRMWHRDRQARRCEAARRRLRWRR